MIAVFYSGGVDHRRGGTFLVAPDNVVEAARQRYEPDSGVLTTEMRSPTGLVRVTDATTLRRGASLLALPHPQAFSHVGLISSGINLARRAVQP